MIRKERAEFGFRFSSIEQITLSASTLLSTSLLKVLFSALHDFYPAGMGLGGLWILYVNLLQKKSHFQDNLMEKQLTFDYLQQQQSITVMRRRVCDLPAEERPLYRLHHVGSGGLATTELLALILGTAEAPGLAQSLLDRFGSLHQLARISKAQLMKVHGIGESQAGRLVAVLELSRRLQTPAEERPQVTSPAVCANLLLPRLSHLDQEEIHVILLDTRNRLLSIEAVYRGSLNTSMIRMGELFRPAIERPAAAIVLAHNHPSGDPSPSPEDIKVTRQAVEAGKLLDVEVIDHLIIGSGVYTSLKERSLGFD
jgi:DNA repair protein RadC